MAKKKFDQRDKLFQERRKRANAIASRKLFDGVVAARGRRKSGNAIDCRRILSQGLSEGRSRRGALRRAKRLQSDRHARREWRRQNGSRDPFALLRRRRDNDLPVRSEEGSSFAFCCLRRVIPTIVVRKISAFAVILIGTCLVPSLEAKDIIRDKSLDGRFALRITKEDEDWGAGDHQSQKQTRRRGTGDLREFHRGSAFGVVEGFTKSCVFRAGSPRWQYHCLFSQRLGLRRSIAAVR